ncbi:MAG: hypothetical protein GY943_19995, partial [Chloroflexi bacterium]|nr:hypothetical protein [Chloroflexota bacterium]
HAFGQLVHQSVIHPLGREAVSNTNIWHSLDIGSEQLKARWTDEPIYDMTALQTETAPALHAGPIFDALKYDGFSEALGSVHVAWRAYHDLPIVELVLDWNKKWHNKPEAAYVTFPFATKDADLQLEASGGFFRPGSFDAGGQLPGTCTTYYTVQRAAQITTPKQASLLWMPLDAPLVMTNSLEFNRWEREPWQWNGFLASMPVNHYWHTNFAISQRGHIRLRYRFMAKQPDESIESALGAVMPLDALGWR